jgi:hypothetical protein
MLLTQKKFKSWDPFRSIINRFVSSKEGKKTHDRSLSYVTICVLCKSFLDNDWSQIRNKLWETDVSKCG